MRATAAWAAALALASTLLVGIAPAAPASAAPAATAGSDFDPGFIISDELFYDGAAMSAIEIQAFLDSKIGTCQNSLCLNVTSVTTPNYASWTSQTTGQLACAAVSGGTMKAAEWIYRVQTACGISAKVILVTLQKEQGLVEGSGARAPDDWGLKHAMGMACPDTAPCDTAFAGLATQIYAGTKQIKVYKAAQFGRQPGVQYVQWSPDASCGGSYVDVRNYATAALYNYTPYQPNQAALSNLFGIGDSCSSYGNRNFWTFYTSWFGSTGYVDGAAIIATEYARTGGSTGPLGASLAQRSCARASLVCWQDYQNGLIGWSRAAGAWTVLRGPIYTAYLAAGGPTGAWGAPTSLEEAVDSPGVNGAGTRQNFQRVQALSSASGAFGVSTVAMSEYARVGWVRGSLGWPTGVEVCSGTNCVQQFQGGMLGRAGTEAFVMDPTIVNAYRAAGGPTGVWGLPTSSSASYDSVNGSGQRQNFQGGQVLKSAAGVFLVGGRIFDAYAAAGWIRGSLGWPLASEVCSGTNCVQQFQGGVLGRTSTETFLIPPVVAVAYAAAGGTSGTWGLPTSSSALYDSVNGSGQRQNFQGGQVLASTAGVFLVGGRIYDAYAAAGWIRGSLGWPTGDKVCDSTGACTQQFQFGTIASPAGGGAASVLDTGPIAVAYAASGGASGPWGAVTSDIASYDSVNGSGQRQNFKNGQALSSTAGVFLVGGRIYDAYAAAGWIRGSLGWPTGDKVCDSTGACTQQFQFGTIASPAGGGAASVLDTGPIAVAYAASGGASGPWGAVTSDIASYDSVNGSGQRQNFKNGQALSSTAGVFLVGGRIYDAYAAAGWIRGSLGWPTGDKVCDSTGACTQQFQNGSITAPAGGGPASVADSGPIAVAYAASGGASGPWGAVISGVASYDSVNGSGQRQNYANGQALSSTAGVFLVGGRIYDAYAAAGWIRGSLGWPTGDKVCDSTGACTQQFQNGSITAPAGSGPATVVG